MRFCVIFCAVLCLVSCTKTTTNNYPAKRAPSKTASLKKAEKLLQMSAQGNSQESAHFKLQAAEYLITADDIAQAQYTIEDDFVDVKLDATNSAHKQILLAQIALAKQNIPVAKQHLRSIWTPAKLPEDLLIKFYQTRSEIYTRSGNLLDAVQDRIFLAKHLNNQIEQAENYQTIWDILTQLTPKTLQSMPRDQTKSELNGWLEFASISKQYNASSEQLLSAYQDWQKQYPRHPALQFMPSHMHTTTVKAETTNVNSQHIIAAPKKIALMLPLQGAHAKSAQAIRDGFLAAYYANDTPNKPKIQVYDTTAQNMHNLYRKIVEQGADFIVGPLTKEEVESLASSTNPEIPMLALNNSNRASTENILQFSLSPESEAQAVANKAWRDGHRNAAIIIPKSAWGKRMQTAFTKAWQEQGGTIVNVAEISSQTNLNPAIKNLLGIDASEARAQKLKQSGIKAQFDPRRRQDVDMVFIATNAALARQVKPLLNFYYAGNIPAYAASSVYTGRNQPSLDQDLNGIQFCDMPWILDASIEAQNPYKQAQSNADIDQYARLYALGLDAYKIALQIEQLTMMPNVGISGMTGMLNLNKQQNIDRKLMWASFKKGVPEVNGYQ